MISKSLQQRMANKNTIRWHVRNLINSWHPPETWWKRKQDSIWKCFVCAFVVSLQTVSVFMCVVYFNFFPHSFDCLRDIKHMWSKRDRRSKKNIYWNLWLFAHICSPFRFSFQPYIRFIPQRKHSLYHSVELFSCCRPLFTCTVAIQPHTHTLAQTYNAHNLTAKLSVTPFQMNEIQDLCSEHKDSSAKR